MKLKSLITITSAASLMWSCVNDSGNENVDDFDITEILANAADNIILPQFEDLKESTDKLNSAYADFQSSSTPENLTALQSKFKDSYALWQACSFVNYGNSTLVSLSGALNTYPTDTANINSTFGLTEVNLESASYVDAIGFPGLDYILFEGSENQITDRATTIGSEYCSNNVELIKTKSESAYNYWKNNTDGFYSDFKTNASKSVGSPFTFFVNGYVKNVEVLKNGQLGFPAGKFTLNNPQPNQSEALYSGHGVALFKAHLANLKRIYKGEDLLGTDGIGLDDYLKSLGTKRDGQDLNELILTTFNTLEEKASQLSGTMNEAIQNQSEITDELYQKIKELVAYLKVDMTNAIGVQITYIDNDGD